MTLHPLEFAKDHIYWATHPQHGTFTARLIVASPGNLALRLDVPTGRAINPTLFLMYEARGYVCLYSGDVWTIHDTEPQ